MNEVTKAQPTFDLGVRGGFVTTHTTEKGTSGKFSHALFPLKFM